MNNINAGYLQVKTTALNDFRKIICLRKSEVSVERLSGLMSLKIWRNMAYTPTVYAMFLTNYKRDAT